MRDLDESQIQALREEFDRCIMRACEILSVKPAGEITFIQGGFKVTQTYGENPEESLHITQGKRICSV